MRRNSYPVDARRGRPCSPRAADWAPKPPRRSRRRAWSRPRRRTVPLHVPRHPRRRARGGLGGRAGRGLRRQPVCLRERAGAPGSAADGHGGSARRDRAARRSAAAARRGCRRRHLGAVRGGEGGSRRALPQERAPVIRSTDAGRTWSVPRTVNEGSDSGPTISTPSPRRPDGSILATGSMLGRGSRASGSVAPPTVARTWEANRPIHPEPTCPCCRTAVAIAGDGTIYAAWREILPGDVRDVVVTRSSDGGKTWAPPVASRADGWVYPGCPHAGPSLKVDAKGAVHVAWWTGKEGEAGVYYARSTDGAQTSPRTESRPARRQSGARAARVSRIAG